MEKRALPIGEVAERFGLNASTLRYYEEIGLLPAAERRGGRRHYGFAELKRLAFIQMFQEAGLVPLADVASLLDGHADRPNWHKVMEQQVVGLERQIERAQAAKQFLEHMASCPREDPVRDCPVIEELLEHRIKQGKASAPNDGTGRTNTDERAITDRRKKHPHRVGNTLRRRNSSSQNKK